MVVTGSGLIQNPQIKHQFTLPYLSMPVQLSVLFKTQEPLSSTYPLLLPDVSLESPYYLMPDFSQV